MYKGRFIIKLAASFIFILAIIFQVAAQDKKSLRREREFITQGDRYFKILEYYHAAQEYQNALSLFPDNKYTLYKLAECYRLFFNYEKAEEYYRKVLDKHAHDFPVARYWYASMLKHNGRYFKASENYEHFIQDHKSKDKESAAFIEKAKVELVGCEQAIHEMKKPQRDYQFENLQLPVNTIHSEYAPVIYESDSSIVVTSAREESEGEQRFGGLGGEFSDNYRFDFKDNRWVLRENKDDFDGLNTKFNEGAGSFNKDKTKFYFTRCDEKVELKNMDRQVDVDNFHDYTCMIYVSVLKNGKWSKPAKLNEGVNMKGQWNAQPCISPNADTLFFVSKRPGGFGMSDIYYSTCLADDNWSNARNMGDKINTAFADMSPSYYAKEKTLFFASNGHKGFGGLDIFKAVGNNFEEVTNLGLPFNSNGDDFYFSLGDQKGYLSSNRKGGKGNDDIYRFNIKGKDPVITIVKKDSMEIIKSVSIEGKIVAEKSSKPAEDVEILLMDDKNKVLKKTVTDESGNFKYENLPADKNYKVAVNEKSNHKLTKGVDYMVEGVDVKGSDKEATKILFENVFFNFDSYELRPEAKKVLDDLADFFKSHPYIQIEMNANTDNLGSEDYNIKLSYERGRTSLNYLIAKGVKKTGLVINALGEGTPLASNTNGIGRQLNRRVEFYIIGEPQHNSAYMAYIVEPKTSINTVAKMFNMSVSELKTLNNLQADNLATYKPLRVKKISMDDIVAPQTLDLIESPASDKLKEGEEYYTVQPQNTLFSIAKNAGMTPEQLRQMNDLEDDRIMVGQKLKVRKRPE